MRRSYFFVFFFMLPALSVAACASACDLARLGTCVGCEGGGGSESGGAPPMEGHLPGAGGCGDLGGGGEGGAEESDPYAGQKVCDEKCVPVSDPAYGCTLDGCKPCKGFSNAITQCLLGTCVMTDCKPGFVNCNDAITDGCEAHPADDPENCGACGRACPYGACEAGKCNPICGPDNILVSTQGYAICYEVSPTDHPPNAYLGVSGRYTDQNGMLVERSPFPGCVAQSATANQVVCNDLDIEPESHMWLGPGFHAGMGDLNNPTAIQLCTKSSQSPVCRGRLTFFKNGEAIATFQDPPLPPFDYAANQKTLYWELFYETVP